MADYRYGCEYATLFAAPNSLVLVRVQHSTSSFEPESLLPTVECFDDVCFPDTDTAEVDVAGVLVVAPLEAADAYENVPAARVCSFPLTGPNEAGGNESIARASEPTTAEEVELEVAVAVLIEGFGCIFLVLLPIQESVLQLET